MIHIIRKSKLFVVALLASVVMFSGVANAIPAEDGTAPTEKQISRECRAEYDGKTFVKGSDKAKEFNNSVCNKPKYCKKADVKNKSDRFKISCSIVQNPTSGSPDFTTDDEEQLVDPALNCQQGDCDVVRNYVNPAIRLLTVLVGIAIVAGMIFGAILVITSAGDPQKAAKGKSHIQNAIIAIVAYVFLFAFIEWILPGGFI